jgi:predicted DNA-binding protein
MNKKSFAKGIDAFLGVDKNNTSTPKEDSLKENIKEKQLIRTTLRIDPELITKLKALAYWNRQTATDLISKALNQFVESFEHEHLSLALNKYKESLSQK